ncbi:hypothetical protein Q4E93_07110 [Flavitalea sp. BT771]|uniref:hypothetical protein n=1 Tax=Flavitalea sp. BT771 TaxID=3063329 RepID=UPI0026E3708D|nr:hypothetical protein [Flavitalea sp. BT771]MDO6430347.1 hypothetical protein [Flavitalea sp. BT771]MDV6219513.1 hypothetical protein [Flavitalea sp. BT771]
MKKNIKMMLAVQSLVLIFSLQLFISCSPSVKLTASWSDRNVQPVRFSKILVTAIGKDLEKRKLAEDNIKGELQDRGFAAATSLDEFGPDFAKMNDSAAMRGMLLDKAFDGALTVRVLNINEHDRWVPGSFYYAPVGFYRGFYGYYRRVWGYYSEPGYYTTDVEVLLESNLYLLATGELLWSGQSKAFSRNPTPEMARRYAKNIIDDMIDKRVIAP